jgi:hypothetical protein
MAVDTALRTAEPEAHRPLLGAVEDRRLAAFTSAPIRTESPAIFRDAIFRRALVAADALVTIVMLGVLFGNDLRPSALLLPVVLVLVAKTMNLYDRDEVVVCKRTLDDFRRCSPSASGWPITSSSRCPSGRARCSSCGSP